MQKYTFTSNQFSAFANKFKDVTTSGENAYFNAVEVGSGSQSGSYYNWAKCRIDGTITFEMWHNTSNNDETIKLTGLSGTTTMTGGSSAYFGELIQTDNAVIVKMFNRSSNAYQSMFMLCKDAEGGVLVVGIRSGSSANVFTAPAQAADTVQYFMTFSLLGSGRYETLANCDTDTTNRIAMCMQLPNFTAATQKVYFAQKRPFPADSGEFLCTIGGKSYLAVGYSTFFIETE